uniref:Cuticle protein CP1876 n=1 Tax=Cancer pagurus TaxID=6755 RepID=CUPC5_CANPG|nr:RecName: Full=Cuticle protein CP1876; Short=CPCP1876 [Cancer pagurus]
LIPDDPDVAAEKARFFRTFKIIEGASKPRGGGIAVRPALPPGADVYTMPRPQPKWMGPLASKVPASLPGSTAFVSETSDVQNARSHFFNTYNAQVAATMPSPDSPTYYYSPSAPAYVPDAPQEKWTGPLASAVPAGLPGSSPVVFDTPEVYNAKAAFFNTYKNQVKAIIPRPSYF